MAIAVTNKPVRDCGPLAESRATMAAERIDMMPNTSAKGKIYRPTSMIDSCWTSCSHVGRKNSMPVKTSTR